MEGVFRDRVKEFRRVPSGELQDNDRNWRVHPYAQTKALEEILERVGIAGALTAYHSDRNGGRLTLIDGHARRGHQAEWPTLILDVSDEEADLLLLTLDPLAGMAEPDGEALLLLLGEATGGTPALEDLLHGLAAGADVDGDVDAAEDADLAGPPEMELQVFEHYDYVVFLFRDVQDWRSAAELLGLEREAFTLRDGATKKIGLGRVVDGRRLLALLKKRR